MLENEARFYQTLMSSGISFVITTQPFPTPGDLHRAERRL